ncbi:MAG TPA: hypothetical protein VGJ09_00065, partial [Bryobacteraceae bacterium]
TRELLTPVRRVRTAREFLARICPEIEAVQGSLPADAAGLMESADAAAAARSSADQPPEMPTPALGYAMEILFGLILVDAILIPVAQLFPILGTPASSLLLTTFFTEVVLAIFVLVRRASHDPRRTAFVLTGVALACMAVDVFGIGRSMVTWFVQVMEAAQRQQTIAPQLSVNLSPIWMSFSVGWRVCIGLAGLVASRMERSGKATAGASSVGTTGVGTAQ